MKNSNQQNWEGFEQATPTLSAINHKILRYFKSYFYCSILHVVYIVQDEVILTLCWMEKMENTGIEKDVKLNFRTC